MAPCMSCRHDVCLVPSRSLVVRLPPIDWKTRRGLSSNLEQKRKREFSTPQESQRRRGLDPLMIWGGGVVSPP